MLKIVMKLLCFLIFFSFMSCANSQTIFFPLNKSFPDVYFNVVEKELYFQDSIPDSIRNIIKKWFDSKVKVNGFEGAIRMSFIEYEEIKSDIDGGKKIDLTLKFSINFINSNENIKKNISGSVNSYGTISGNFSLNEFDALIEESQFELLSQLSGKIIEIN